jgi:uncharacterized membrane protein
MHTMTKSVELFEMRRLEALSNTIFGVAMTLLAYDLPEASGFSAAPAWAELANAYAQKIIVLLISFIVAGIFWMSHHRRLTLAPEAGRGIVFLNLLFLASIIILPATNGLYGAYQHSRVVAAIYGVHLTIIAGLNALLWLLALKGRDRYWEIAGPAIIPVFVFAFGTAVAFVAPSASVYIWNLAFIAPLAGWLISRRKSSL